jgi:iron complex outermembrane receptor protein
MGGVVNIVSQRATSAPYREVRFATGSEQTYQGIMNYGAARGAFDYWLSMGVSSTDGYQLSNDYEPETIEDGGLRYNSAQRHFNLEGKANYVLKDSTLLSLSTGYYDSERDLPSGTDRAVFQKFSLWRRWYLDAGGDGRIGSNLFWRAKLYYDDADNRLQRYNDSIMVDSNLVFDSYHDSYDFGGNLTTTAKISSKLENTSGASARVDAIRKQNDIGDPWLSGKNVTLSVFEQVCYSPVTSLRVEAGLSVNRMEANEVNAEETALDPYASVLYTPIGWLELRAAIANATRFPTLNHLYSTESGNPDLSPERALKYDLGYALELSPSLSWSQTYFRSDVDDLIDRKSKRDLYENIHEVTLEGLETGITLRQWRNLSISFAYTYLEAVEERLIGGSTVSVRRQHSPRQKTDYMISYRTGFGMEFAHTGQYIADRVDPDLEPLPDYYVAHLKVSQEVRPGIRLFTSARNILDKNFVEEKYYPMPGRSVQVGFEILL